MRKEYNVISHGNFIPLYEEDDQIFAYIRNYRDEKLLVVNNFYKEETLFKLPENIDLDKLKIKILISNYKDSSKDIKNLKLRPYESIVYHLEKLNH